MLIDWVHHHNLGGICHGIKFRAHHPDLDRIRDVPVLMIPYTKVYRIILFGNNWIRVIGDRPVFTKNKKFSKPLSLSGESDHIDGG